MQNKHVSSILFAMALMSLVGLGCSKLTGKTSTDGVPKEQIDRDLAAQKLPAVGGADWDFSKDSMRCFEAPKEKSAISDVEATIFVMVASARGDMKAELGSGATLDTLFGTLRVTYKKNGGSWQLDKVTPDHLSQKALGEAALAKFFELAAPLCSFYEMKK